MAMIGGMNKFEAGKAMALMSGEIRSAAANITRRFKAGLEVDLSEVDQIEAHAKSMREIVEYWKTRDARDAGKAIKTQ